MYSVPDGNQTIKIMKELINKHCSELEASDLEELEFDTMAKYFYDFVPKDTRIDFFNVSDPHAAVRHH